MVPGVRFSRFLVAHYWETSLSFIICEREHPSLPRVFWRRSELAQLMTTTVLDLVKKLKTAITLSPPSLFSFVLLNMRSLGVNEARQIK